ncbi:putative 60S ribosomal protein L28 [Melia azedarach]|uniref:60S ribosomal protein L28 n=2 Tax=Melia azedarach TaxID=155640 RepID=A0ACC1XBQ2_MELAZ|nr:putative 60S ribosomal protein L28 [Melia azedarach]
MYITTASPYPTISAALNPPSFSRSYLPGKAPMATVPGQLIWEIVKKNNCFLVKQFGRGNAGVQFSKESNNLYNLNSFKHSGLANKKTVTIQPGGKDLSVVLATTKTKKQNKPASLLHKSAMRKEFPRMAKAVVNQVADNYYRPDLKKAALARLSVVQRSLKVAKSGVKKRNRQAMKVPVRK